nr:MAG: wsv143-like protein [Penaeus semisulcatus pemonivirus]
MEVDVSDTRWVPIDVDGLTNQVSRIEVVHEKEETYYRTLTDYLLVTAVADGPQDLCRYSGVNIALHGLLLAKGWARNHSAINSFGETYRVASAVAIVLGIRTLTAIRKVDMHMDNHNIIDDHISVVDSIVAHNIDRPTEALADNSMTIRHRAVVDAFNSDFSNELDTLVENQTVMEEEEEGGRYDAVDVGRVYIGTFGGKATKGEVIRNADKRNDGRNILMKIHNSFGGTRPCLHSATLYPFLIHSTQYTNETYTDCVFVYTLGGSPCSLTFLRVRFDPRFNVPLILVGVYECYRGEDHLESLFWINGGKVDADIHFKLLCLEELQIENMDHNYHLTSLIPPDTYWKGFQDDDHLDWQNRWHISYYSHAADKLLPPIGTQSQPKLLLDDVFVKFDWSPIESYANNSFPFQDVMSNTYLSMSDALSLNSHTSHLPSKEYMEQIEIMASNSESTLKLSSKALVGWSIATDLVATMVPQPMKTERDHRGTASIVAIPIISYIRNLRMVIEQEKMSNLLPFAATAVSASYDETTRLGEETIEIACEWVKKFKKTLNIIPYNINDDILKDSVNKLSNIEEIEKSGSLLYSGSGDVFEFFQSFFISSVNHDWGDEEPKKLIAKTQYLFIVAHLARTTAVQIPRLTTRNLLSHINDLIIKPLIYNVIKDSLTTKIYDSWTQTYRALLVLRQLLPSAVHNMRSLLPSNNGSEGFEALDLIRCNLQAEMSDWWSSKELIKDLKHTPVSLLTLAAAGIRAVAVAVIEIINVLSSLDIFLRPSTWNWGVFDRALTLLLAAASANYAYHTKPKDHHAGVVAANRYLAGICRNFKVLYDFEFSSVMAYSLNQIVRTDYTFGQSILRHSIGEFAKNQTEYVEDSAVIRWPLLSAERLIDINSTAVNRNVEQILQKSLLQIRQQSMVSNYGDPMAFAILSSLLYVETWKLKMDSMIEVAFSSATANEQTSSKRRKIAHKDNNGSWKSRKTFSSGLTIQNTSSRRRKLAHTENFDDKVNAIESDIQVHDTWSADAITKDRITSDNVVAIPIASNVEEMEANSEKEVEFETIPEVIGDNIAVGYPITSRGGKYGGLDSNVDSILPNLDLSSDNPSISSIIELPPSDTSDSTALALLPGKSMQDSSLTVATIPRSPNIVIEVKGVLDELREEASRIERVSTNAYNMLTELMNYNKQQKPDEALVTLQSHIDDNLENLNKSLMKNIETQTTSITEMVSSLSSESKGEEDYLIGKLRELIELQKTTNIQAANHLDQIRTTLTVVPQEMRDRGDVEVTSSVIRKEDVKKFSGASDKEDVKSVDEKKKTKGDAIKDLRAQMKIYEKISNLLLQDITSVTQNIPISKDLETIIENANNAISEYNDFLSENGITDEQLNITSRTSVGIRRLLNQLHKKALKITEAKHMLDVQVRSFGLERDIQNFQLVKQEQPNVHSPNIGTPSLNQPVMVNLERRMLANKVAELCLQIDIVSRRLEDLFDNRDHTIYHEPRQKMTDVIENLREFLLAHGQWLYRELQEAVGYHGFLGHDSDLYRFLHKLGVIEERGLEIYNANDSGNTGFEMQEQVDDISVNTEMEVKEVNEAIAHTSDIDSRVDSNKRLHMIYVKLRSIHYALQWIQTRVQSEEMILQTINMTISHFDSRDSRVINMLSDQSLVSRDRHDAIIKSLSGLDISAQMNMLAELNESRISSIENSLQQEFNNIFGRLENLAVVSQQMTQHLEELTSSVVNPSRDKSVQMIEGSDENIHNFNICIQRVFEVESKEYSDWYKDWRETNYTNFIGKLNNIQDSLTKIMDTNLGGPHVISSIILLTSEISSTVSSYHIRLQSAMTSALERLESKIDKTVFDMCNKNLQQALDTKNIDYTSIKSTLDPILHDLRHQIKLFMVQQRERMSDDITEADHLADQLRGIVSAYVSQSMRKREARNDDNSSSVGQEPSTESRDIESTEGNIDSINDNTNNMSQEPQQPIIRHPRQLQLSKQQEPGIKRQVIAMAESDIVISGKHQQEKDQHLRQPQSSDISISMGQPQSEPTSVHGQQKSPEAVQDSIANGAKPKYDSDSTANGAKPKYDSDVTRLETLKTDSSDRVQQEPMDTNHVPGPKPENSSKGVWLENRVKDVVAEYRLDRPVIVDKRITLKYGDNSDDELHLVVSNNSGVVNGTPPSSKAYEMWNSQDKAVKESLERIRNSLMQHHRPQRQHRFISEDNDLQDCLNMLTADWDNLHFSKNIRFYHPEQISDIKILSSSTLNEPGLAQFQELMRLTSQDTTPIIAADDGTPWDRRRRMPCRLNSLLYNIVAVDAKVVRRIAAIVGSFRRSVTNKLTGKSILKDNVDRALWLEMTISASLTAARSIWERSAELAAINRANDAAPSYITLASDRSLYRNRDVEHVARLLLIPSGPDDTTRILATILMVTFIVDHIALYEMRVERCLQVMVDAHLDGLRVKLLGLPHDLNYKERVTKFGVEYDFNATRRILQDQRRSLAELKETILDSLHSSLLVLLTFTVDTSKTIADPEQRSFLGSLSEEDLIVQNSEQELSDQISSDPVVLKIKLYRLDDEITRMKESVERGDQKVVPDIERLKRQRGHLIRQLKCFDLKSGSTSIYGPGAFRVGPIVMEARRFFNNRVNIKGTAISIPIDRDLSYDRLRNHRTPISHLQLASLYLPPSGRGTAAEGWLLSDEFGTCNKIDHTSDNGSEDPLDTIARLLLIPPDRVSVSSDRNRSSANVKAYQRTWDEGVSLSEKRHPSTSEAKSITRVNNDTTAFPVAPGVIFIIPSSWKFTEVLTRTLTNTDPEHICAVGSRQTGQVILYPTQDQSVGADLWPVPSIRLIKQMLSFVSVHPKKVEDYEAPASAINRQMNKLAVSNLLMILRRGTLGDSKVRNFIRYAPSITRANGWPPPSPYISQPPSTSGTVSGSSEMRAIVLPAPKVISKANKEVGFSENGYFKRAGSGVAVIASDLKDEYTQKDIGLPEHNNHNIFWAALERGAGHIVPISLKWVLGAIPVDIRNTLSLSITNLGESAVIVTPPTFLTALTSATWR